MLKQIFGDGAKYIASRIVVGVLFFLSVPVIVSFFGLDVYGIYSQKIALAGAISALLHSAVYQSYLRYGAQDMTFESAFSGLIGVSLLIYVAYFIFSIFDFFPLEINLIVVNLCVSIGIYQIFRVHLQVNRRIGLFSVAEIVRTLVIIFTPLLLLFHLNVDGVSGLLAGFIIGNIVYIVVIFLRIFGCGVRLAWKSVPCSRIVKYGGPIALWLGVAGTMNFLDRTLAIDLYSPDLAGAFAVYADIYNRIGALFIIPISTSIIPIVIGRAHSEVVFSKGFYFFILSLVAISFSAVATGAIFGYSNRLSDYSFIIMDHGHTFLFLAGLSFWQLSILTHKFLELSGKTGWMVFAILTSVIFHYGVLFAFKGNSNLNGFAYAYFASGVAYTLLTYMISSCLIRKGV